MLGRFKLQGSTGLLYKAKSEHKLFNEGQQIAESPIEHGGQGVNARRTLISIYFFYCNKFYVKSCRLMKNPFAYCNSCRAYVRISGEMMILSATGIYDHTYSLLCGVLGQLSN